MAKVDFTIPVDLVIRITDIDEDEIEDDIEWLLDENYIKISTLPTTKPFNNEN